MGRDPRGQQSIRPPVNHPDRVPLEGC